MKHLTAIALVALALTGCGTQPATVSPLQAGTVAASGKRQELQLYGSFIVGKVLKAKTITERNEKGQAFQFQELTVDVDPKGGKSGQHGKIIFRVIMGNPRVEAGQVVDTFVNYTVIDGRTNTFINKPGKPFWAYRLKVVG